MSGFIDTFGGIILIAAFIAAMYFAASCAKKSDEKWEDETQSAQDVCEQRGGIDTMVVIRDHVTQREYVAICKDGTIHKPVRI